jgi:ribonuclease HI
MSVRAPHFLLHSRTRRQQDQPCWSFSLEATDRSVSLAVEDAEPDAAGERLELLAVVRGLEAIPSPSRVTLVTSSTYVNRVLDGGLDEWRTNGWKWERHGEMVPVKNHDLWRRVDRAFRVHQIHARRCRVNLPNEVCSSPKLEDKPTDSIDQTVGRRHSSRRSQGDTRFSLKLPQVQAAALKRRARKLLALWAIARRRIRQIDRSLSTSQEKHGNAFAAYL